MKKLSFFPLLLVVLLIFSVSPGAANAALATPPLSAASAASVRSGTATPTPAALQSSASSLGIVVVTLHDSAIDMPASVPAGSLTFTVTNMSRLPHNFAVVGEDVERRFVRDLRPNESQSMSITLLPGTYQVYSPVDDDRGKGVVATLTVTGASYPGTGAPAAGPVPSATAAVAAAKATPGAAAASAAGSLERVGWLAEYHLQDAGGQRLGDVGDVVFDWATGQILYVAAVPAAGARSATNVPGTPGPNSGQAGSSQTAVLIPWHALSVNRPDRTLVLNVPATSLAQAPTFSLAQGLDTSRPGWDAANQSFWRGLGISAGMSAAVAQGTPGAATQATPGSSAVASPIGTAGPSAGAATPAAFATPAAPGTALPTASAAATVVGGTVAATPTTSGASVSAGTAAALTTTVPTMAPATDGTALPTPGTPGQNLPGGTVAATPIVTSRLEGITTTPAPATAASTSPNVSTPAAPSAGTPAAAAAPVSTAEAAAQVSTPQPPVTSSAGVPAAGTSVASPTAAAGAAGPTTIALGTPTAVAGAAGSVSQAAGLMPVNTIIGFSVKDSAGKDLGHISELVGSLGAGKVTYAILTSGGILGLGGQSAAVPWDLFSLDQGQQAFVVNADQQAVQQAPGFDQGVIDRGDPNWDATLRTYWHNHGLPAGASNADQNPMRVSPLLRSSAKANSEANLGTITSILVAVLPGGSGPTPAQVTPTPRNAGPGTPGTPAGEPAGARTTASTPAESGRFMYAVVGYGGILGFGEQAVPVPWNAFSVDPQKHTFTGRFDEWTFQQAPSIDIAKLPQTPSAGWDSAIQAYWSGRTRTP